MSYSARVSRLTLGLSLMMAGLWCQHGWAAQEDDTNRCVIIGSLHYKDFARAQKLEKRARSGGFEDAAIYDTRYVEGLAWGQWAVIATQTESRSEAKKAVKALKRLRLSAYHKACGLDAGHTPIESRDEIDPLPVLPKTPLKLDPTKELPSGCLGWSSKWSSALCVTGGGSIQESYEWGVGFPPSKRDPIEIVKAQEHDFDWKRTLKGASRAKFMSRLKAGGFVSLPDLKWELSPNTARSWALPRVTLRWRRRSAGSDGDPETGEWETFIDTVEVRCGGSKNPFVAIVDEEPTPDDGPELTVISIPGWRYMLLIWETAFGIEGDHGDDTTVHVLDATDSTCGQE